MDRRSGRQRQNERGEGEGLGHGDILHLVIW
jgi:hypothetical protein